MCNKTRKCNLEQISNVRLMSHLELYGNVHKQAKHSTCNVFVVLYISIYIQIGVQKKDTVFVPSINLFNEPFRGALRI